MRTLLFATALTAALGTAAPTFVHAAPTTNLPAERAPADVRSAEAPQPQPADADEAAYADAESKNPDAADFTGGSTVVIIGSTTAIILAVLLILVLI